MPEEKSIKNQIAAMEAWAIDSKGKVDAGNYKEAKADLRNINTQGRRLEWRGGRYGLKRLPDFDEVNQLKKLISAARAAVHSSITSIDNFQMLQKLQKRKKIRESQTKKKVIKKRKGLQRDIKKYISILIEDLKQARAIAEAEPWTNLDVISKHKHYRVFLGEFLRGDYYYKNLGEDRIKIWNSWWKQGFRVSLYDFNLIGADLRGIDLEGANLEHINLWKANLAGADLRRANLGNGHLYEAILKGADLKGADLSGANLRWADLRRANLAGANLRLADLEEANLRRTDIRGADLWAANLRKANLAGADLWGADLKGADLEHADLTMVKTLTKEQLHSAKNWEKAKNIPEELL